MVTLGGYSAVCFLLLKNGFVQVPEASQVASFPLPGSWGSSGSVLLFTWCLFCKTGVYYKYRVRICTFLETFCVCYVDLGE